MGFKVGDGGGCELAEIEGRDKHLAASHGTSQRFVTCAKMQQNMAFPGRTCSLKWLCLGYWWQ